MTENQLFALLWTGLFFLVHLGFMARAILRPHREPASRVASDHWKAMRDAGVHVASGLPIGKPLLRPLRGRIDLRNHRKIVVIDNQITYCGSQNCADPEFRVKVKYAPWVDAMMRFEEAWFSGGVIEHRTHNVEHRTLNRVRRSSVQFSGLSVGGSKKGKDPDRRL